MKQRQPVANLIQLAAGVLYFHTLLVHSVVVLSILYRKMKDTFTKPNKVFSLYQITCFLTKTLISYPFHL
uniref:Uncharacterized protein n=1 Tax=Tolypothrix bouteillei VB521301 TaxID=1479485 RepID=A0A0C1QW43_9CYAN